MLNQLKLKYYASGAAITMGLFAASGPAQAQTVGGGASGSGTTFSTIAENINTSVESVPGLITGLSYLFGLLLGTLGVMKIKDHVENPTQTPLKDGAIRLASGGALFALPIVFDAMSNTISAGQGGDVGASQLNRVEFNVN